MVFSKSVPDVPTAGTVEETTTDAQKQEEMDSLYPEALDGFVAVLTCDGDVVYLSENVTKYLGLSRVTNSGLSLLCGKIACRVNPLASCTATATATIKRTEPWVLLNVCTSG